MFSLIMSSTLSLPTLRSEKIMIVQVFEKYFLKKSFYLEVYTNHK